MTSSPNPMSIPDQCALNRSQFSLGTPVANPMKLSTSSCQSVANLHDPIALSNN
ncbi:hypothetical protein RBSWK_00353 [Rhodopirellula baltica SWK14]|uniref:Uncharacterized protein n=1 Tax=Rhodopirellula baltica SWK14 TaxID=993516 RepID=L7CNU4_RHOBT|nr:hypothetical protein RBSWK_00353 [Rhodopirellula baltica SWK14]